MNAKLDAEVADRAAEDRSENEGMPEHPAKARDPVRRAAERRARVSQLRSERPSGHIGMLGIALMSCAALAALASARGAVRWRRHKGGALGLPR